MENLFIQLEGSSPERVHIYADDVRLSGVDGRDPLHLIRLAPLRVENHSFWVDTQARTVPLEVGMPSLLVRDIDAWVTITPAGPDVKWDIVGRPGVIPNGTYTFDRDSYRAELKRSITQIHAWGPVRRKILRFTEEGRRDARREDWPTPDAWDPWTCPDMIWMCDME